jgi:hypothetical protein
VVLPVNNIFDKALRKSNRICQKSADFIDFFGPEGDEDGRIYMPPQFLDDESNTNHASFHLSSRSSAAPDVQGHLSRFLA